MADSYTYTFDRDQMEALYALLDLVHYDTLAAEYYRALPIEFQGDLAWKAWREDVDGPRDTAEAEAGT